MSGGPCGGPDRWVITDPAASSGLHNRGKTDESLLGVDLGKQAMNETAHILVVDDEKQNRSLMRALLESIGYECEVAGDGPDALTKLKAGPDLVLLDVRMRGLDGYGVTERIREDPDHGHIPIVMVTALTGRNDRLRAMAAGATGFITKPVDKVELRVCIESLLRMK